MYRVKRAIIMAAGKGERMHPVTETTPKPLIPVNGKRMIDTVIEALHENGITEIYIVTGFLKEQFEVLTSKYSGVRLIENPFYETCNNDVETDNGCGFDPATAPGPEQGHFGLLGVRERLNDFGGSFDLESTPGKGAKATISLKLSQSSDSSQTSHLS